MYLLYSILAFAEVLVLFASAISLVVLALRQVIKAISGSIDAAVNAGSPNADPRFTALDPVGVCGHDRGKGGNAVAMKRRLHQPALPQVRGALAGQQPFAEDALRSLEPLALVEILVVRDQDVADQRRIADGGERRPRVADASD